MCQEFEIKMRYLGDKREKERKETSDEVFIDIRKKQKKEKIFAKIIYFRSSLKNLHFIEKIFHH